MARVLGGGVYRRRKGKNTSSENVTEKNNLDDYISGALSRMSMEERETTYNEIHGVDVLPEESDDLVSQSLDAIYTKIGKLKDKSSMKNSLHALMLAESQDKSCVYTKKEMLKFLRAERFNAKRAAVRLAEYYDLKLTLFGKEKLCRRITLLDLTENEQSFMKQGLQQVLPARDRAGRTVGMVVPNFGADFANPHTPVSSTSSDRFNGQRPDWM